MLPLLLPLLPSVNCLSLSKLNKQFNLGDTNYATNHLLESYGIDYLRIQFYFYIIFFYWCFSTVCNFFHFKKCLAAILLLRSVSSILCLQCVAHPGSRSTQ